MPREVEVVYPAHYWQRRFHASPKQFRGIVAGIRSGKTVAGSMDTLASVLKLPTSLPWMVTGPDFPMMRRTSIYTIAEGVGPHRLGRWPRELIVPQDTANGLLDAENRLHLRTGHQVWFVSGDDPNKMRGPALGGWWADEFTYFKTRDVALDVLLGRVLDTGGRGIATCTPKGKDWFWTRVVMPLLEAEAGRVWSGDSWDVFSYPTADNPAINATALALLAAQYTGRMVDQELFGRFVDWAGALFPGWCLDAAKNLPGHDDQVFAGHKYGLGFDPAGKGKDWSVAIVACERCRALVDIWRAQRPPFAVMYDEIERLVRKWRPRWFTYDQTSMGGQAIGEELESRVLRVQRELGDFRVEVEGYVFGAKSKVDLLTRSLARWEEGLAVPETERFAPVVNEHRAYEWDDKKLVTDCVMGTALAVWPFPPRGEKRREEALVLGANLRPDPNA